MQQRGKALRIGQPPRCVSRYRTPLTIPQDATDPTNNKSQNAPNGPMSPISFGFPLVRIQSNKADDNTTPVSKPRRAAAISLGAAQTVEAHAANPNHAAG